MKLREICENIDDPFAEPESLVLTDEQKLEELKKQQESVFYVAWYSYGAYKKLANTFILGKDFDFKPHNQFMFKSNIEINHNSAPKFFINTPDIIQRVRRVEQLGERYKTNLNKNDKLRNNIKNLEKIIRKNRISAHLATSNISKTIPKSQIPDNQIPQIIANGKRGFANPYWHGTMDRYAGDPNIYPFSTVTMDNFILLSKILKENNIPGFTIMYSSKYNEGKNTYLNFAILAANGKFVWRKYQTSPANGQSWIYANGNRVNAQDLIHTSKLKQQLLKGL